MTTTAIARGWRSDLAELAASAKSEFFLAAPFLKQSEMRWLADRLASSVSLSVLTDIRGDSVIAGSLDLAGLRYLAEHRGARVVTLRGLHAKVMVSDHAAAIVTSGNLTQSGIDRNFEYGLRVDDRALVTTIRSDLALYETLGHPVDLDTLRTFESQADALVADAERVENSQSKALDGEFQQHFRSTDDAFIAAQVGVRSATGMFRSALRVALAAGPLTTTELGEAVRALIPDLCDDTRDLVINGERFGKQWKHTLRNAQQAMKRAGEATYDNASRRWSLTG
ncbi:MAG: hypothetical protein FJ037_04385 [Chloroflexi bacterium]|nr:hypothetical protein [Chloroflexota bacterium]